MREFQLIDEVMPGLPPASPADVNAVRARVLDGGRRRSRRPIVLAVAAALGAFALLLPWSGGDQVTTATTSGPRTELEAAADRLAAQPTGSGANWLREMDQVYVQRAPEGGYLTQERLRDQLWSTEDGRNTGVYQQLSVKPFRPGDAAAWKKAGSPELCTMDCGRRYISKPTAEIFELAQGLQLPIARVLALPTDPGTLAEELLRSYPSGAKVDRDTWLWRAGERLLLDSPATPATRAAVYRMLAALPGTTIAAGISDVDGRPGIALRRGAPIQEQLVIDPETGNLLASQDVAVDQVASVARMVGVGVPYQSFVIRRLGWTDEPPRLPKH
ncbi:CU044_5270 family protein [Nonomuraea sp. NPDC005983]|uniref:CU044_5270 family protein n=1 Tax=Nonomuraea sp. NPDC005983 TaxID=3155595 RepID=UPI0033B432E9